MKNVFFRFYIKIRSVLQLKHWRGHGIHSPFMYRTMRMAIMKRRVTDVHSLQQVNFRQLRIAPREQTILKNLYTINRYDDCTVVGARKNSLRNGVLYIVPPSCSDESLRYLMRKVIEQRSELTHVCIAICGTNRSPHRYQLSNRFMHQTDCVSVAMHCMGALFFEQGVQKQHYHLRN